MCFAFEVPCHYHRRQPMSREVKSHVTSAPRLLIEHGRHKTRHALMSRERPTGDVAMATHHAPGSSKSIGITLQGDRHTDMCLSFI